MRFLRLATIFAVVRRRIGVYMKKFMVVLLFQLGSILILTACNIETQDQTKIEDSTLDESMPFVDLTRDDIVGIKIFEASLDSEISLSDSETVKMIDLLNDVVIYEEVTEETIVGQMIHIKINKTDNTSIWIKCASPYFIIDDVWYKAAYEPSEEINRYVNDEIIN